MNIRTTIAPDSFLARHLGSNENEIAQMLHFLGQNSLDEFSKTVLPKNIVLSKNLSLPEALTEFELTKELRRIAATNKISRSYIGLGYYASILPPVIARNILENPGWYTAYTPYQAEISQGRMEALVNFQTMVCDLTGMQIANASMLDEGSAAAEAMHMLHGASVKPNEGKSRFFVGDSVFQHTLEVIKTRARALDIEIVTGPDAAAPKSGCFGAVFQYPAQDGSVTDLSKTAASAKEAGMAVAIAADLLALTLLKEPGLWGVDVVVGNTQRFGLPLGYGGPHAGYFATTDAYRRSIPGRLIGVSKDSHGNPAYRLALQTREQHIRRDKATSNICTAQVLPAVLASMYAVYHGPQGLKNIAEKINAKTAALAAALKKIGHEVYTKDFFDTLRVGLKGISASQLITRAEENGFNLRAISESEIGISLDETVSSEDLKELLAVLGAGNIDDPMGHAGSDGEPEKNAGVKSSIPPQLRRETDFLTHPVFNSHHTETEMLRYIRRLESKDLSLTTSMIALGSCTMKLNASTEMYPISWPEFSAIHPFAPASQTRGYSRIFADLEGWLSELTGFSAVSLQPNAGSQGEFAGLLAIRGYHESRGQGHRRVCLIPVSAHGTNPASAALAGFKVVAVDCDDAGNVDLADLHKKAEEHAGDLAALMVTYPSTHGVFEPGIRDICDTIHKYGGQVYLDGANMNAMVALARPADIGADVCHLNLHKTFCIPHGGGGPGVGPIGVAKHLVEFLPGHNILGKSGAVASAPWGSASILVISWAYIRMLGAEGLAAATKLAILNANYIAAKLDPVFPVLYKGSGGFVAHECILDTRGAKKTAGVEVEDIAKRLIDYGFHAPTMSFPVPGTLMVEPTESESKEELDRFIDAMVHIHQEIAAIETGKSNRDDNPLKHSPHTAESLISDSWSHVYSRESAAYPALWLRERKFWPSVGRVDNAYGDRNLFCSCVPPEGMPGAQ